MRASGQAISQASGRLGGILGVTLYGVLAAADGPGAGLVLFAVTALLGGLATLAFVPETRDPSLAKAATDASADPHSVDPACIRLRVPSR